MTSVTMRFTRVWEKISMQRGTINNLYPVFTAQPRPHGEITSGGDPAVERTDDRRVPQRPQQLELTLDYEDGLLVLSRPAPHSVHKGASMNQNSKSFSLTRFVRSLRKCSISTPGVMKSSLESGGFICICGMWENCLEEKHVKGRIYPVHPASCAAGTFS